MDNNKFLVDAVKAVAAPVLGYLTKEAADTVDKYKNNLGNSHKTYLTIENLTSEPFKIQMSTVENHDWDGSSRPENFDNVTVAAHGSVTNHQELNAKSTMKFSVNGEERFEFRNNQWNSLVTQDSTCDLANKYHARFVGSDSNLKVSITRS